MTCGANQVTRHRLGIDNLIFNCSAGFGLWDDDGYINNTMAWNWRRENTTGSTTGQANHKALAYTEGDPFSFTARNNLIIRHRYGASVRHYTGTNGDLDGNAYINCDFVGLDARTSTNLTHLSDLQSYIASKGWTLGDESNGYEGTDAHADIFEDFEEYPEQDADQYNWTIKSTATNIYQAGVHMTTVDGATSSSDTFTAVNPYLFWGSFDRDDLPQQPIYIEDIGAVNVVEVDWSTGDVTIDQTVSIADGARIWPGTTNTPNIGASFFPFGPDAPEEVLGGGSSVPTYYYTNHEQRYQVRIFDASNNVVAIYDDLISVTYKKTVNEVGMAILAVPAFHPLLDYAVDDQLMELFISYPDRHVASGSSIHQSWKADFLGLYRDYQLATDDNGNVYYLLYFPSTLEVLSRYVNAWPASTDGKTSWVGQQLAIIANDVVRWNCTSDATAANGRLRDATVIRDLNDAGAISGTSVVDYRVSPGRNVLDFLQELAPILGFDIDVNRYGSDPTRLEAKQYDGQLGSDLSADIIFSLSLDNLSSAHLSGDRLREKTVAIVGGAGEEASRTYAIVTGVNYAASNDYEMFVNGRDKLDAELEDTGDAALGKEQARRQVGGAISSSLGYIYGRDYNLGDLVSVEFAGAIETKKITSVSVEYGQSQKVTIGVEFSEP